jgi:hypothetical protein
MCKKIQLACSRRPNLLTAAVQSARDIPIAAIAEEK